MSGSNQLWTSAALAPESNNLLEQVVDRRNMVSACRRVVKNGGSPGVDGMKTENLWGWLQRNHDRLAKSLQEGRYRPKPVRLAEIEKPGGGKRGLGIPTVVDRMIQQAMHQVLKPLFDPEFSESSFGYRTGIMRDGVTSPQKQGTPQGSPLSPLLSNILLNELDKELERRGHSFCRYADDFVIFVKSEKAAGRVFDSVVDYIEKKLKLRINRSKSQITRYYRLTFLGFGFLQETRPD
jgi:retron-type reverse transcriptase